MRASQLCPSVVAVFCCFSLFHSFPMAETAKSSPTNVLRLGPSSWLTSLANGHPRWQLIRRKPSPPSKPTKPIQSMSSRPNRWNRFNRRLGSLQSVLNAVLPVAVPSSRRPSNSIKASQPPNRRQSVLSTVLGRPETKPIKKNLVESRQLGLIRTLFRYPLLLVFSNLFNLPLLPMLLLASPGLNGLPLASSLASSSPALSLATSLLGGANASPLSSSSSSAPITIPQLGQMFSVNSSGVFGSFITDLITEIQAGSNLVNDFLQTVGNAIVKPNRVGVSSGNFANAQPHIGARRPPSAPSAPTLSGGFHANSSSATFGTWVNGTEVVLATNDSSDAGYSFSNELSPSSSSPFSSSDGSNSVVPPAGSNLLNQLATSLVESSKKHHISGDWPVLRSFKLRV